MKLSKVSLSILLLSNIYITLSHAEEFKPNGSIGFTQTFYGNAGGYKTATSHPSFLLNYNFTPQWNLQIE